MCTLESHAYIIRVEAKAPIKEFEAISRVKHVICFRTLFLPVQDQKYHPKLWAHGKDYVLFSLVILYSAFWYCKALVYNHRPLLIFFLLSSWTNNKMLHADGFVRCWLVIYISFLLFSPNILWCLCWYHTICLWRFCLIHEYIWAEPGCIPN